MKLLKQQNTCKKKTCFIKGQASGKLTSCGNDFTCLEHQGKLFVYKEISSISFAHQRKPVAFLL